MNPAGDPDDPGRAGSVHQRVVPPGTVAPFAMLAARHSRPVAGPRGAVAAAHPLAVSAATEVLARGGSAVDAAIAAQAVICVTMPHAAGLGGDLLALVGGPGTGVVAVGGTGCSPAAPAPYRSTGGGSVTVPGLVGAWSRAHARWGRIDLPDVLSDAVRIAELGFLVDAGLAGAVVAQRARLVEGGAVDWPLLRRQPGRLWVQPELAGLLRAVGERGEAAFYAGTAAEALVRAVARSGGVMSIGDLREHRTDLADPITVGFAGDQVSVQPPSSQGVLLAMALSALEELTGAPDAPATDHLLVELTEAAFEHRSDCGLGADLLRRPLRVDPERASGRGGPRAYLHTAGVATADASGLVVSSLISVFDDFGSGVFVPELGIVLNNRGAGFTDGANAPGPGRRPVHTLAPAMVRQADGGLLALATPGADGQVQTLLQLLVALRTGRSLAEAIAAPRWRSENARLMVEAHHESRDDLARRGHAVVVRSPGDELFGAVVAAGHDGQQPYAAADWRRSVASGAT